MTQYLIPILYGNGYPVLFPVLFLFAMLGTGALLLKCFRRKFSFLTAAVAGMDSAALLYLLGLWLFPGSETIRILNILLIACGCAGFLFGARPDLNPRALFRKENAVWLLPAGILLAYTGFIFTYPCAWDECVYQLAVPRRWAELGSLAVQNDIPYSGFPALPQILYVPLIAAGGITAVRIFYFLCQCILIAGIVPLFRRERLGGAIAISVFLLAPTVAAGFRDAYAELFLALNLLAGLRMRPDGTGKTEIQAGFFAGAMTAVKLTGGLSAVCFLLWRLCVASSGQKKRILLPFVIAGFLAAAPFYLRPLIETGNPCYPYLAQLFSPEHTELSSYHHRLGTDRFGYENPVTGLLRSLPQLSMPASGKVFDGTYGLSLPVWAFALLLFLLYCLRSPHGKRRIAERFLPLLFFYSGWFFTSPQARFLMPGFLFAIAPAVLTLRILTGWKKKIFLGILFLCALCSIQPKTAVSLGRDWKQLFTGTEQTQLDLLYGRTGQDYLPACFLLTEADRQQEGNMLLFFEERTLYMPVRARVATPLFQDRYVLKSVTAESMRDLLDRNSVRTVYLRIPVNNPDLLEDMLALYPKYEAALFELAKNGYWENVRKLPDAKAFVFTR